MTSFEGKSAVVLGGNGGIGVEIVRSLISSGLKNVGVIDVADEPNGLLLGAAENVNLVYRKALVEDLKGLREAMESIKNEFKGLDFVINSAGVLDELNPVRTFTVNYGGVVNSTLIGIDLLRRDHGGHGGVIVNVASTAALGQFFWFPVYTGSKHAVLGFTRSLANEAFFERTGVSFITINPGFTETPMVDDPLYFDKTLFPEMMDEMKRLAGALAHQEPEVVGQCVVGAIRDGENGAVWQVENSRAEKIEVFEYPRF